MLKWDLAKLYPLWKEKRCSWYYQPHSCLGSKGIFFWGWLLFSRNYFYFSLTVSSLKKWQNQGIVETRKELLRLSPVPLLKARTTTADFLRTMPRQVSSISKDGDHTQQLLWENCSQYLITITIEKVKFVSLSGISCISACAHFLLPFLWAALRSQHPLYPRQLLLHMGKGSPWIVSFPG